MRRSLLNVFLGIVFLMLFSCGGSAGGSVSGEVLKIGTYADTLASIWRVHSTLSSEDGALFLATVSAYCVDLEQFKHLDGKCGEDIIRIGQSGEKKQDIMMVGGMYAMSLQQGQKQVVEQQLEQILKHAYGVQR